MDEERFESLAGQLLVAAPVLDDPNFARTVVLVIDHDAEGAVGVVLNRPGARDVSQVLPHYEPLAAPPRVLFGGGPVTPDGVLCVAFADHPSTERFKTFLGGLGVLGLDDDEPGEGIQRVRLFHGYAGWSEGQLEQELALGAWFVVQAQPADAFSEDPDNLWSHVLRREGGQFALLATLPEDPSLN